MLVLKRTAAPTPHDPPGADSVRITVPGGEVIDVIVLEAAGRYVRLGFTAAPEVRIDRGDLKAKPPEVT